MRGRKFKKVAYHSQTLDEDNKKREEHGSPLQIKDFSLTQNQYLMIMSKLPKCFSLQPVKNAQKSKKLLYELGEKPSKKLEKEKKRQEKQRIEMLHRESSRMTIRSDQSEDKQEQSSAIQANLEKIEQPQPSESLLQDNSERKKQPDISSFTHIEGLKIEQPEKQAILESSIVQAKAVKGAFQAPTLFKKRSKRGRKARQKTEAAPKNLQVEVPPREFKSEEKPLLSNPSEISQSYEQKFSLQWQILKSLQGHSMIDPFTSPVDELRDCVPRYFQIIKNPMDLGTIQKKLRNHIYSDSSQFHADVQLMWRNSYTFNKPASAMSKITAELERFYENLKSGKKMKGTLQQKRGRKR